MTVHRVRVVRQVATWDFRKDGPHTWRYRWRCVCGRGDQRGNAASTRAEAETLARRHLSELPADALPGAAGDAGRPIAEVPAAVGPPSPDPGAGRTTHPTRRNR
jgi:hypothetical protein